MTKKKTAKKKAKTSTVKTETKMTSGDHTKKVDEAKEIHRALVSGRDAIVLINIFPPDNEPKEFKVRIPKIVNTCPPPHRESGYIAGVIIGALKRKYGHRVK